MGAAVLGSLVADLHQPIARQLRTFLAAATGFVAAIWAGYVLQYLSWTEVGDALVEGFQGRYFIPALALALPVAALRNTGARLGRAMQALLTAPVVLLATVAMIVIPAVTLSSYYVR